MRVNRFSIKDIETITGIKSHTLRIWEQRYDLLQTKRSDTNIRYYDDEDLKFLLNVAALIDVGHKISKVAKLSHEEMAETVAQLVKVEGNCSSHIQSITQATINLDEEAFEQAWKIARKKLGFEQAMLKVVYPFLTSLGIMWQTGAINPAQEHFATSLIKQHLIVAISEIKPIKNPDAKRFLLFLPEMEFHEIGLLFAHYLVKSHAHHVLYLGQNLNVHYVKEVCDAYKPDFIMSILTNNVQEEEIQRRIQNFITLFPENKVLITGNAVKGHNISEMENIIPLENVTDLLAFLSDLEVGQVKHEASF
jgi:DNA-binding transcriptional MerR regulator